MTFDRERRARGKKQDPNNPEALVRFMMTRWKPQRQALPRPLTAAAFHARRRAALSARFPRDTLVIPTGHEKVRANDTYYRFRPGSDFFYLTGNTEPDAVLVLTPRARGGHASHLFVEPNPGRANETFYTDRKKGELWVGARLGVEQSRARFGVDHALPLDQLKGFLARRPRARVLRGLSSGVDASITPRKERDDEGALGTSSGSSKTRSSCASCRR